MRQRIDFFRLFVGCVILPENEHAIGVFGKFGQQGQRRPVFIHCDRCGAGRIHRNADNFSGNFRRSLCQSHFDGCFQAFQIIQWMLAEHRGGRIAVFSSLPARIIIDCGCYFPSVGSICNKRTDGIGTVVKSNYIIHIQ